MRAIKYRELKRMYETNGPEKTVRHLQEALQNGDLKPEDFSVRELAEATLSRVQERTFLAGVGDCGGTVAGVGAKWVAGAGF